MNNKLNLVLCWHMHQPWYRERQDGEFRLPWVYLHALKDYSDMAHHLEAHPNVRAVVNFVPVLLEQLDAYAKQGRDWIDNGTPFSDPMLNLLAGVTPIPESNKDREQLVHLCTRANRERMIDAHNHFHRLCHYVHPDPTQPIDHRIIPHLKDSYFLDLLTWYHLAWLGHSIKQRDDVKSLMEKGGCYTEADRKQLIGIMTEVFEGIIPRFRALAEKEQIELSMTPYAHPIVPLLIDFNSMDCSMPEAPKPFYPDYTGGEDRAHWHMQHGLEVFEHYFGIRPRGVWLSEGSVSNEALYLLSEFGFSWTASGEGVWNNSCRLSQLDVDNPDFRRNLFSVQQVGNKDTRVFFRDDGLSDLIGFEYQSWIAEDGARDFVRNLENINNYLGENAQQHVVSVILDGENAWEYYPDNAFHFLGALYEELANSHVVNLMTFDQATQECPSVHLPTLCAGSWVYGTFSTWIGDPDKNRGWNRLVEAKEIFDEVMATDELSDEEQEEATRQLAICEGSDWFWWFGDYNPSDSVRDFDELYRLQLKHLYLLLKRPIPTNLNDPLSTGGGEVANGGTMRRGHNH